MVPQREAAAVAVALALAGSSGSGGGSGGGGFLSRLRDGNGSGWGQWVDFEYLIWYSKERRIPPLVTTSPAGTLQAAAGELGLPTTTILFGDELIGDDPQSGYRFSFGTWLDTHHTFGIGGRYFSVGDEGDTFSASSTGDPILARPYFDVATGSQEALLVAFPNVNSGNINIEATNEARGFDVYLRKLLLAGYCNRVDFIGGYQYTNVEDSVRAAHQLTVEQLGGQIPQGSQVSTVDLFEVENEFHGGFFGVSAVAEDGRLTWRLLTKVAFGNMNQQATVSGSTVTSVPPPTPSSSTAPFGLLALPTNIGSVDRDEFAVVPEINLSVGMKLTRNIQVTVGYNFIYWSKIALAGDIVDTTIDTSQIPGPSAATRPTVNLVDDDGFWYQGVSVGGNIRF